MGIINVVSADDPRLADYRNVPDPELIERGGIFVAEGRLVVRRLLAAGTLTTRSVLVTPTALEAIADMLPRRADVPVLVAPQAIVNQVIGFNIHRGCLAIGERPRLLPWQELARGARRLLILERVGNADNVGAIFRNAAAFDADAVLLGPSCTDPLYRKAIRTSMGAALSLPFAHLTPWPQALGELRQSGRVLIGLTPWSGAPALNEVLERERGGAIALVLGHEGDGLTADARAECQHLARIPQSDRTDSLNVATAAAIGLYELARG